MLPYALFAYRETPHEETGFSPFELLYGWPVRGPTEILKLAMTGEEDVEKSVIEHVINVSLNSQLAKVLILHHQAKNGAFYCFCHIRLSFSTVCQ
jgi:hypothetical protein